MNATRTFSGYSHIIIKDTWDGIPMEGKESSFSLGSPEGKTLSKSRCTGSYSLLIALLLYLYKYQNVQALHANRTQVQTYQSPIMNAPHPQLADLCRYCCLSLLIGNDSEHCRNAKKITQSDAL